MFSGIIEDRQSIIHFEPGTSVSRIRIKKPSEFSDLRTGDSIAVNGVCLTLEEQTSSEMSFALAAETLQVLGSALQLWLKRPVNLERSLRFGDRMHGHFVSGHVDCIGNVLEVESLGEDTRKIRVGFPEKLKNYIWPKGSIAVNGVSLTINEVGPAYFEVCLIPETLKRTNLEWSEVGESVCLEADPMAKAIARQVELMNLSARLGSES